MITRRSFLALLSAVPFVGQWIPRKVSTRPCYYVTAEEARAAIQAAMGLPVSQPEIHPKLWFHKDAFAFVSEPFYGERRHVDVLYGWGHTKPEYTGRWIELRTTDRPRLTFAEWDRRYQG